MALSYSQLQQLFLYLWYPEGDSSFFFFLPYMCMCVCVHVYTYPCLFVFGERACFFVFNREVSIYIKKCQDTWKMHGRENFKGVNQENKWVTPMELYTMLYCLIPSKFFMVNVITVTDHLYWSATQWYGLTYNYLENFLESRSKLGNERYSLYTSEQCREELLKLFTAWRQLSK